MISVSQRRVVKHFPNDDFSVRIQNQCRCLKLSAWLSRNIFYTTIIQQNIGILSSECKCYLLRRLSIICFNTSNSDSASNESVTVELSAKKIFLELTFPGLFSFSCTPSDSRLSYITSFWRDSSEKLSFAAIFHSLSMQIFIT